MQAEAVQLGLDGEAFAACLESGETAAQVQAQMEQGRAMGVSGTPAFFINDWFISGAQPSEKVVIVSCFARLAIAGIAAALVGFCRLASGLVGRLLGGLWRSGFMVF